MWSPVAAEWHWVCNIQFQSKQWVPAHACLAASSALSPGQSTSAGSAYWSTTDWSMLSKKQRKQQNTLHLNYIMTKDIVGTLVEQFDHQSTIKINENIQKH